MTDSLHKLFSDVLSRQVAAQINLPFTCGL